jgi:hypothetical protein
MTLPNALLEDYGSTFIISELSYKDKFIIRTIEFPPEYHQAGISILNYFGTVLRMKYPNQKAKVSLDQEDLKVTMTVEPLGGDPEIIEMALDEYGLVIRGKMAIEDFTDDQFLLIGLREELRAAYNKIETQRELLKLKDAHIDEFKRLLTDSIKRPNKIYIYSRASARASSEQKFHMKFSPLISVIHGSLNELEEQLPTGSVEAESVQELQKSLEHIEKTNSPEDVAKSSAMSKFRRFLENVEKAETTAGKVIKTTKDGIHIARQLAGHYNKIAQWCGLTQVPEPFVKK